MFLRVTESGCLRLILLLLLLLLLRYCFCLTMGVAVCFLRRCARRIVVRYRRSFFSFHRGRHSFVCVCRPAHASACEGRAPLSSSSCSGSCSTSLQRSDGHRPSRNRARSVSSSPLGCPGRPCFIAVSRALTQLDTCLASSRCLTARPRWRLAM